MRAWWSLTLTELRRFRGPLPILSAIFLALVPLLYGATYLWSNWDPYGRLGQLQVAVVNLDRPVKAEGETVHGGRDIVDQLMADRSSFDWQPTDAGTAAAGVADGRFAFSITVPEDFSADLTAIAATDNPKRAHVTVAFDNSQGYILGIMAETAEKELQSQLNAAAVKAYAESAFGSIARLRAGLSEATDAAGKLATGSAKVAAGVKTLEDKVVPVVKKVSAVLRSSAKEAAGVSKQVSGTTADIASLAADIDSRQDDVSDALGDLIEQHPELADDDAYKALKTAVGRVSSITGETKSTTARVSKDAKTVAGAAALVNQRVPEIIDAAQTAVDQIDELRQGAEQVADGNAKLRNGLKKATDALPSLSAAERAADADAIANPVQIASEVANPAVYYGRGLAPFFFGVALWVFGLVAFVLMRPLSTRGIAAGTNSVIVALGGWAPPGLFGAIGALILLAVTDLALGLHPVDWWSTAGLSVLAVASFTALAQAMRAWLGLVGSAVVLVLLIIQLGSAGGLYPVEVMPEFFQAAHVVSPMTYLVGALRVSITGGSTGQLMAGVYVLGGLLLASLALVSAAAFKQRVWTPTRLHPPLE